MKTSIIIPFYFLIMNSAFASYRELPTNFDSLNMSCSIWDEAESDSKEQSLEKFSISSTINGSREFFPNNSKQNSFECEETEEGLYCEGSAYQIYDDQDEDEVSEDQKFKLSVELDYSKHRSDLIEGTGKIGFSSYDLYCEILGKRDYQ